MFPAVAWLVTLPAQSLKAIQSITMKQSFLTLVAVAAILNAAPVPTTKPTAEPEAAASIYGKYGGYGTYAPPQGGYGKYSG